MPELQPPYYAVIFSSKLAGPNDAYTVMAERMEALAAEQDGYLGFESQRSIEGDGLSVSYWRDEAAILAWKQQIDHQLAQKLGQQNWYKSYRVQVSKVVRAYGK
jgi:heme-degrading monooxygenase HmoA